MFYQIIKINKTQRLLKYEFGAQGVTFLEKTTGKLFVFLSAVKLLINTFQHIFVIEIVTSRHNLNVSNVQCTYTTVMYMNPICQA
jgi:hypothetical protein